MKIWLLTSSPDNLYLFRFLNEYNFSYHIWYDQECAHRWDKTPLFVEQRIIQWLDYLISQGVEKCILPPIWELVFLKIEKYQKYIMPLFSQVLVDAILPKSRVGKIWFIGDWSDLQNQASVQSYINAYVLTDNQKSTKKFNHPFVFWSKETPLWKHFLIWLEWKNWMMHNVIKHDLRYFLDAWIDTLLPLNYWYLAYDTTITKYLRTKKCHRSTLTNVRSTYDALTKEYTQDVYSVSIIHTGTLAHLQAEKKWMWLLQKGKQVDITFIAL